MSDSIQHGGQHNTSRRPRKGIAFWQHVSVVGGMGGAVLGAIIYNLFSMTTDPRCIILPACIAGIVLYWRLTR